MSNSYNISVAPDVAAVKVVVDATGVIVADIHDTDLPAVKIDTADVRTDVTAIHDTDLPAVKADTADVRTDVTAIHDTNLPAVKADTADVRTDVTAIHDTDLPAVKADTADVRTDVTAIHDTNLPAVKTDTNSIGVIVTDVHDTDLPAVKTVVDEIRATDITTITDAITAKAIRGELKYTHHNTTSATYEDVINISGKGKLVTLMMNTLTAGDEQYMLLHVDSVDFFVIAQTGIADEFISFNSVNPDDKKLLLYTEPFLLNMEFNTSLIIEHKRDSGTGICQCAAVYQED